MNYNWDVVDLVNELTNIEKIYNETSDLKIKQHIIQVIKRINTYIIEINMKRKNVEDSPLSLDEQYSRFMSAYYDYYLYSDIVSNYFNKLSGVYLEDYDDAHIINKGLSIEDYFFSIHDFYKGLGDEFYNYFMKLYKDRFICYKLDTSYNEAYGSIYNIPYLNKSYIVQCYNERHPSCSEILTGVHEYGHGIASIINNNRYLCDEYLDEIESTFFELVAIDYYSSHLKTNEFYKLAYDNMTIQYDNCDYSFDIEKFIKRYINLSKHGKVLMELNRDKKKNFCIFGSSDLYTEYKYLVSYVVALNLYMIYLEDKEYALYLLKEIINSNCSNEFLNIENSVGHESKVLQYKKILDERLGN